MSNIATITTTTETITGTVVAGEETLTVTINVAARGPAGTGGGGGTDLTSYVTQIESLSDYPDTFPPDLSAVNHATFDTTPSTVPTTEGTLSWNATDHTLNLQTEIADVLMQVGQELLVPIKNLTGATLTNGTAVAITGSTGDRMSVEKAIASNAAHAVSTIGLVTHEVAHGEDGYVNILGRVRELTTNGYSGAEGSPLYLSAATAGLLTSTKPTNPNWPVRVGWLEKKAGAGAGRIHVACERLSVDEAEVIGATNEATAGTLVRRAASSGNVSFTEISCNGFELRGPAEFSSFTSADNLDANRTYQDPNASGVKALTADTQGRPDALFNGTLSGTTWTFGDGAAVAFFAKLVEGNESTARTELGAGTFGSSLFETATLASAISLLQLPGILLRVAADVTANSVTYVTGGSVALPAGTYIALTHYISSTVGGQNVVQFLASSAVIDTNLALQCLAVGTTGFRGNVAANTSTTRLLCGAGTESNQVMGLFVFKTTGDATISMQVRTNNGLGTATLAAGSAATFIRLF